MVETVKQLLGLEFSYTPEYSWFCIRILTKISNIESLNSLLLSTKRTQFEILQNAHNLWMNSSVHVASRGYSILETKNDAKSIGNADVNLVIFWWTTFPSITSVNLLAVMIELPEIMNHENNKKQINTETVIAVAIFHDIATTWYRQN